ncbi:MAG: DNA ligase (ATP) [Candidatus Magnetoglobus multicellularis str. Araruama]|uniref:DNA ligase (ATP) n=1 Tax=Candidatus Magnetoglobus multicellularis str. Araruama TaxID=890399 RepID=A0A1V1NZX9_9BACT|nr:MAG: DNA ligase (ATP) [Candidatus Magnetoglobus multicellularis str. Araruama]
MLKTHQPHQKNISIKETSWMKLCLLILLLFTCLTQYLYATSTQNKPSLMLAHTWNETMDITNWWMSEKLDGVRGYWTGKQFISRAGNPFYPPKWFTQNFPSIPLDGELWMGRNQFSELISIIKTKNADKKWNKIRYMIFDAPEADKGFEKRLAVAKNWFTQHPNPHVEFIQQEICLNIAHLRKKLKEIESKGGEGLMLRKPDSPYITGRSFDLLKVKSFDDDEATVIQHFKGKGRHADRMGSMLVEMKNGIRFKIGTGFTDNERNHPPPVGSIITFKYYGLTKSGVPKFASFLRVREQF